MLSDCQPRGAGENVTLIAGRLPLHASSSGLVLLAYGRPQFRERILAAVLESGRAPMPRLTLVVCAVYLQRSAEPGM